MIAFLAGFALGLFAGGVVIPIIAYVIILNRVR